MSIENFTEEDLKFLTPTFHIAWSGTDSKNKPLMSEDETLLNYRLFSVANFGKSVYSSSKDFVIETYEKAKEKIPI
ncbi:MAG: hypothetical protein EZS28_022688 [Streblomastix strix]|uniref:Uncharacterized protein n=1 Tax=Streblomastix strix TaxID=222440 RepID=A0A5J4VGR0_9EUKA|nr:MAG: hypothetical protein EZS28_022688 [Streblomastix strix]